MRNRIRKRKNNNKNKFINRINSLNLKNNLIIKKVFPLIIIIVIVAFFSVIFAIMNISNYNILRGIYINNYNVSGMNKNDIKKYFTDILNKKKYDGLKIIHNNEEYILEFGLLQIENNLNETIQEASKIGHSGNILKDNFDIVKTFLFKKNFKLEYTYNEENLKQEINWLFNSLPDKYQKVDYYIEDNNLILSKPVSGVIISEEKLINKFNDYLYDFSNEILNIVLPIEKNTNENIDLEILKNDIYKEPKNAYYIEEPFQIYPEQIGVKFALSDEEIMDLLNEKKEENEYIIPLDMTSPEITLANLEINVFPDTLSKAEGNYDVTNYNRANNLTIAGKKINDYVLAPGEVFSYNKVLGMRTIDAGYKEAAIYSGGKVVNGLGGGICQISSILYNACLMANLDIVERKCHQFLPSYAKPGLDATVAYGAIDFKFKNNRKYPIKISTNIIAGVAEIKILGIKEPTDYMITLKNNVLETIPYNQKTISNSKLSEGEVVKVQSGVNGQVVETYKILSKLNEESKKELISVDKYDVLDEIIEKN